MQTRAELFAIMRKGLPDETDATLNLWIDYLLQLKGCKLYSVASPGKDEKEWLRHRRVGIGGSEIAAILGVNEWNSPRNIWMSKIGMFDDKPATKSEAASWGNLLEDIVAAEWAKRNNRQYIHIPVILVDEECDYLMANIDGFTLSDDRSTVTGILEIKTTSAYNDEAWSVGPLPENYIHQVNWYCGITRLSGYTIVCLVGGQKLYSYDLPALAEIHAKQREVAAKFWNENVLKGVEPEATHVDLEKIKEATEVNEELPPLILSSNQGICNLAEAYVAIRTKISELTKAKEGIYAQLFLSLNGHKEALTDTRTLRVKTANRRSCMYDVLKQKYPAAYEECITHSTSHSLEVK